MTEEEIRRGRRYYKKMLEAEADCRGILEMKYIFRWRRWFEQNGADLFEVALEKQKPA